MPGAVQVGVAVARAGGKAVAGGHQLAAQCVGLGHGRADQLTAVSGDDCQLLPWLVGIQVNFDIAHAVGNRGDAGNRNTDRGANDQRAAAVGPIGEGLGDIGGATWAGHCFARAVQVGDAGAGSAGVVGAINHPKLGGRRNTHRVVKGYPHTGGGVEFCGVETKQFLTHIAIAVNALLVHSVDFFGKCLSQRIQGGPSAAHHLFAKRNQPGQAAAGDA